MSVFVFGNLAGRLPDQRVYFNRSDRHMLVPKAGIPWKRHLPNYDYKIARDELVKPLSVRRQAIEHAWGIFPTLGPIYADSGASGDVANEVSMDLGALALACDH